MVLTPDYRFYFNWVIWAQITKDERSQNSRILNILCKLFYCRLSENFDSRLRKVKLFITKLSRDLSMEIVGTALFIQI